MLVVAAAFETALALGAGTIGPAPGYGVRREATVSLLAALAIVGGSVLEVAFAFRPRVVAAVLAPSAAAFMVAVFFTYDPYYAPTLRRYSDGGAVAGSWIVFVACVAVAAGVLTRFWPRAGAFVSAAVLWLVLLTTAVAGDGH